MLRGFTLHCPGVHASATLSTYRAWLEGLSALGCEKAEEPTEALKNDTVI